MIARTLFAIYITTMFAIAGTWDYTEFHCDTDHECQQLYGGDGYGY